MQCAGFVICELNHWTKPLPERYDHWSISTMFALRQNVLKYSHVGCAVLKYSIWKSANLCNWIFQICTEMVVDMQIAPGFHSLVITINHIYSARKFSAKKFNNIDFRCRTSSPKSKILNNEWDTNQMAHQ